MDGSPPIHPDRDRIVLEPVRSIPEARPGDDPAQLLAEALVRTGRPLGAEDVLVVAQKLISKCEGRLVTLGAEHPGAEAVAVAAVTGQDARLAEVVLRESAEVVRQAPHALIVESRQGFVCANAGVDRSNVPDGMVCLLPVDADLSALRLREGLRAQFGEAPAVIISDTFGRPFREGLCNVALGVAGMSPLRDYRGQRDAHGRVLEGTVVAEADELAAAAELLMGKSAQVPAVIIRGYGPAGEGSGRELLRDRDRDLFREPEPATREEALA
ncbi:MAG: coenzyme F420-0:L-glutamate ligase [Candidatus Dormibacteria bacterium]